MYFCFDIDVTQSIVVILKPVSTRILLHFSYYRLFNLIFFHEHFVGRKKNSFHVTKESERVFVHWWGNNILKCMMAIETTQKRNSNKYNNTNHMPAGKFFFFLLFSHSLYFYFVHFCCFWCCCFGEVYLSTYLFGSGWIKWRLKWNFMRIQCNCFKTSAFRHCV